VFTWNSPFAGDCDSLVTVDFRPAGNTHRTEVIVTHEQLPAGAVESHTRGWTGGLEKLDQACLQGLLK
jgi:hypothetical protein